MSIELDEPFKNNLNKTNSLIDQCAFSETEMKEMKKVQMEEAENSKEDGGTTLESSATDIEMFGDQEKIME